MDFVEKVKGFLFQRQRAYIELFEMKSVYSEIVMEDLARFCRANESTFHPDPRVAAVLEGRREVWLRIIQHTKLDSTELFKLFANRKDIE